MNTDNRALARNGREVVHIAERQKTPSKGGAYRRTLRSSVDQRRAMIITSSAVPGGVLWRELRKHGYPVASRQSPPFLRPTP